MTHPTDEKLDALVELSEKPAPVTLAEALQVPEVRLMAPALEWTKGAWHKTRWVSNTSGAAWAKTSREAAIYSLAVRLDRWAANIAREAKRAKQAADVLAELRPDLARFTERAKWSLRSAGE